MDLEFERFDIFAYLLHIDIFTCSTRIYKYLYIYFVFTQQCNYITITYSMSETNCEMMSVNK